jgi:hypothetical protein
LKHNLGQAKGDDLRSKFEEQIQAHKDTYDANNKEISQLKERVSFCLSDFAVREGDLESEL